MPLSRKVILEYMGSFQNGLLCLGSLVGKSINNGSTQEEGFLPCKQVPFV